MERNRSRSISGDSRNDVTSGIAIVAVNAIVHQRENQHKRTTEENQ
jgi:hypothetical protein